MNMKKILEWTYRIICFTIVDSFILCASFAALYISLTVLTPEQLTIGVKIGIIQAGLGSSFLQVANILYWILDINLFNYKKIFMETKKK